MSNIQTILKSDNVSARFNQLLGKKAPGFISSILQVVHSNDLLSKADPSTVLNAAVTAAILDLPINQNLGYAWIVPYKGQAQFQMGWKGYVQLAQRTGEYKSINVIEVYENQFKGFNRMTEEIEGDFSIEGSGDVVGYVAYFKMLNGFEKTTYWTVEAIKKHAKKYSKAYGKGSISPWNDKDQFHEMAKKTALKNLLSKYGLLSIEMQRANISDQAVINDPDTFDVDYVDNSTGRENAGDLAASKELDNFKEFAKTLNSLKDVDSAMLEYGHTEERMEILRLRELELNNEMETENQ